MITANFRRRSVLATAVAAAALGLAACGGTVSGSPAVANISTTTVATNNGGTASTVPKRDASQSLVQWANCMRGHGDPNQPDPTIDAHGGINIIIPVSSATLSNEVHDGTAPCTAYLAAASADLRAGATNLTPPDQAALLKYSQCMRVNGVPNYPDPGAGSQMNFRDLGIDPNSPFFLGANNKCGREINAPSWWISGAGPPGNISVQSGPMCGNSVCAPSRANRPRPGTAPTTAG